MLAQPCQNERSFSSHRKIPSNWALDASEVISEGAAPFMDKIITEESDYILNQATVVDQSNIIDEQIKLWLSK